MNDNQGSSPSADFGKQYDGAGSTMKDHPLGYDEGQEPGRSLPTFDDPEMPRRAGFGKEKARKVLEKGAKRVTGNDIETLTKKLKEKVGDLKDLEGGLYWLGTMIGRAKLLFSMIRDKEFNLAKGSKFLVAAGLIYFVMPADITPDFIPGIGYIDDAVILGTLWSMLQSELERYMSFLKASGRELSDLDLLAFAEKKGDEKTSVPTSELHGTAPAHTSPHNPMEPHAATM